MNNNQCIKKIMEQMEQLGVKKSGVVLVHGTHQSLGEVEGGATTVIRGLQQGIGEEGTLLMPALTYQTVDGIEIDEFSAKDTPSDAGELSEYFRTMTGVIRSINPTYSVCGKGKYAKEILDQHHLDKTPCGANSPYRLLGQLGGQILFIGCGLDRNTSMHAIEELVQPDYLFGEELKYRVYNNTREKSYMSCRQYRFDGVEQRYERLEQLLEEGITIKKGKILDADCFLVDAKAMWKVCTEAMRANPLHFVEVK